MDMDIYLRITYNRELLKNRYKNEMNERSNRNEIRLALTSTRTTPYSLK